MKIGFVLDDSLDKSDGVQQYILTLGKWFQSKGHDVHYIVGETSRSDIKNIHSLSKNVRARFNQNRMSTPLPVPKQKVKKLLEKEQFDVLHIQMPYSPFLAGRVIKHAPKRTAVVGTFHIIPFSRLESLATTTLGLALRHKNKRIDAIYSVSKPAQQFAKRSFKVSSNVLPNAVNLQHFRSAKPLPEYQDKSLNIVFLGRLVERKGCMYLLEAIEKLHREDKLERVRVLIIGKGPLEADLKTFVQKNHLNHVVTFVGYVDEAQKARYLATADIAVFPSTGGESFGIVLIEAMAAGAKTILGGDNVGYRSVLGDQPKQLVHSRGVDAFAARLHEFISSNKARDHAHKWQREHVKNYDVQVVGSALLSTYESIVAKRQKTNHNS